MSRQQPGGRMRHISLLGWVLILAWAHPPGAWAWGGQGHRTVGAIADRLLTPAAQAAVARLLADDLDKFGRTSGRASLEEVSVWADEINRTDAGQPRWHYDDRPVCGASGKQRYCPDGQCASEQLKRLTGVLADRHAPLRERNEALKWVVHLVADLHQPLHGASNSDRGGNQVHVALEGLHTRGRETLHGAWDNDLVRLALHERRGQRPPADLAPLTAEAASLLRDGGQGDPDSWALESNNLARNVAYDYPGFACGEVAAGILVLDDAYQEQAQALVHERLLLAGARLAALLNRILSPTGP